MGSRRSLRALRAGAVVKPPPLSLETGTRCSSSSKTVHSFIPCKARKRKHPHASSGKLRSASRRVGCLSFASMVLRHLQNSRRAGPKGFPGRCLKGHGTRGRSETLGTAVPTHCQREFRALNAAEARGHYADRTVAGLQPKLRFQNCLHEATTAHCWTETEREREG